jgi:hypothetical protein
MFSFLILQVGHLESFLLIDSGCSPHMTADRRWFSSLIPVVSKEYITFGENGRGRVLLVGTLKISDSVTLSMLLSSLSGSICFRFPNFLMRVLRYV